MDFVYTIQLFNARVLLSRRKRY